MINTSQIMASANLSPASILLDQKSCWVREFLSPVRDWFNSFDQSCDQPFSGLWESAHSCGQVRYSASVSLSKSDAVPQSILLTFHLYSNVSIVNEPFFLPIGASLQPVNATTWLAIDTASLLTFRSLARSL